MHLFDWILVGVLNGAIILYGLIRSRETKSSADWFLAGRSLPWWMVGLSLYATAIDSADLVAVSGATYILGIRLFVINWMGVMIGWVSAAHFIILPMYRAGMYTNSEYLEAPVRCDRPCLQHPGAGAKPHARSGSYRDRYLPGAGDRLRLGSTCLVGCRSDGSCRHDLHGSRRPEVGRGD